ncbi:DNA-binding response OmpR family regulator [Sphingomonas trueperi]|uniref:response regulator transcription factor n=1 Tax=Sphingomonas trueperi TaxID=53317 RepID=UPI003393F1EE
MYHSVGPFDEDMGDPISSVASVKIGRVLVVEEDLGSRRAILSYLVDRQCSPMGCGVADVLRHLRSQSFGLITLNMRLGAVDGVDMLRQIRTLSDVPVILYADGPQADGDRIIGLELGADDVLSGPLNPDMLLARARAVLRRQELGRDVIACLRGGYAFRGWELCNATRELKAPDGADVSLTKREYALLVALLASPGRTLSRLHLMRATRTQEDVYDRSIDVQILRLRRRLESHPSGRGLIRTERGVGYALDAQVETLF